MPKNPDKGFRHVEHRRAMAILYTVLRLSVIGMLVAQFFNQNYENVFLCVLTLILFILPSARTSNRANPYAATILNKMCKYGDRLQKGKKSKIFLSPSGINFA